jgi:TatD DNase family protein
MPMPLWTDSHCHLDAAEFDTDRDEVVARAAAAGVARMVLPAVAPFDFETVRELAHRHRLHYALGIHPLCVGGVGDDALERLQEALQARRDDPRLVAIGEIGLDHFVPGLDRVRQEHFYIEQLKLARQFGLPVILHVRRSADALAKQLRRFADVPGGIAHAFNGSAQQAAFFVERGFKLGFGGAATFDRALQIRELARTLPLAAMVVETDSPDIPPHWLYRTAAERAAGAVSRNEPAELPRIGAAIAALRGLPADEFAQATSDNALAALPGLAR